LGGIAMARKPQQQQHWQKNIERLQLESILITTPQNFYCYTENKQRVCALHRQLTTRRAASHLTFTLTQLDTGIDIAQFFEES
jgi:hypothetical protein